MNRQLEINREYETIPENDSISILNDEFKNVMQILVAEYIGSITRNYSTEHKRLSLYTYYPPMDPKKIQTLAIDNITSWEIKHELNEKVYKQLEFIFKEQIINWNSVMQTTTKRLIANTVDDAVELLREKLFENIENDQQTSNIIIQRFVLNNNLLEII